MPFIADNVADSLIYIYILEFILNSNGIWHCYRFSASQPKNGNVADAALPASAPIADAGKTASAPGAGAVAVFLGAGCHLLLMPRFGTVSGNGTRHPAPLETGEPYHARARRYRVHCSRQHPA